MRCKEKSICWVCACKEQMILEYLEIENLSQKPNKYDSSELKTS